MSQPTIESCDCHIHFGGLIRPEFISNHFYGGDRLIELQKSMICNSGHGLLTPLLHGFGTGGVLDEVVGSSPSRYDDFFTKFKTLDQVDWTLAAVEASIIDICQHSLPARRNLIHFSVDKYVARGLDPVAVIELVAAAFDKYSSDGVRLILSLKYESPPVWQTELSNRVLADQTAKRALVGIGFVGDERQANFELCAVLANRWRAAGKAVFMHVGEYCGADNVLKALEQVGVTDVCHGIKAAASPLFERIISCANANGVYFHMSPTSNVLTGVIPNVMWLPIDTFLYSGAAVTVSTDDPVQCNTTLDQEFSFVKILVGEDRVNDLKRTALNRIKAIWGQP